MSDTHEPGTIVQVVDALRNIPGTVVTDWNFLAAAWIEETFSTRDEYGAPWPFSGKPIPPEDLERARLYVRERGWVA